MSVLDVLSGLSTAAGKGYEGYGQDQQIKVRNALALQQEARAAENDKVLNAFRRTQTAKVNAPAGPEYRIENGQRIDVGANTAQPIAGYQAPVRPPEYRIDNGQRIDVGAGTATPVAGYVKPPEKEDLTPTPGPNGQVVWAPKVKGTVVPGVTPTPRMARAPTEAQEKSYLFHNLMEKAEPEIEAAITSGKVRPEAVSAFLVSSKIPLAGGLLSALVNSGLNAEEQTLLRSGSDFTAGVKRKESGAAVSNPEIAEVFGRYFPGIFGDTPELTASKKAARKAYRETMRQSALPATTYYQQVEKQGAPEVDPAAEAVDPGSGNVAPARKAAPAIGSREAAEAHLKSQGKTAAQIRQILGPP